MDSDPRSTQRKKEEKMCQLGSGSEVRDVEPKEREIGIPRKSFYMKIGTDHRR